jgi:hypothetical protein
MSTAPVGTHPDTGEGCAEELASLTAALSVGRVVDLVVEG